MYHDRWIQKTFFYLQQLNIGWGKSITEALIEYNLPTDLTTIKNTSRRQWKKTVIEKIEVRNASRLHEDCHKKENNELVPKTKTAPAVCKQSTEQATKIPCVNFNTISFKVT